MERLRVIEGGCLGQVAELTEYFERVVETLPDGDLRIRIERRLMLGRRLLASPQSPANPPLLVSLPGSRGALGLVSAVPSLTVRAG